MFFVAYSLIVLVLALLPAALTFKNLTLFHRSPDSPSPTGAQPKVSVLIPARDEESGIQATLESLLKNDYQGEWETLVLDDHSADRTAEIVRGLAQNAPRLKLHSAPELPSGWNGKQHACWHLANLATGDILIFMDADIRLEPDAIRRAVGAYESGVSKNEELALLSGFPRQQMGSWSEHWLVPMMYTLLLGYLPLEQMRGSKSPAFGAGCGQLFLASRDKYMVAKGHEAICGSRHDGLQLPRSFRKAGYATDLFDASDIASVRMYSDFKSMIVGLLKNANEGIAREPLLFVFTILLGGGIVLPLLSFPHAVYYGWQMTAQILLGIALLLSLTPRFLIAKRLGHPLWHTLIHPLATLLFLGLQWVAFLRDKLGIGPPAWRGRD